MRSQGSQTLNALWCNSRGVWLEPCYSPPNVVIAWTVIVNITVPNRYDTAERCSTTEAADAPN